MSMHFSNWLNAAVLTFGTFFLQSSFLQPVAAHEGPHKRLVKENATTAGQPVSAPAAEQSEVNPPAANVPGPNTAKGIVFEDLNGNRVRDENEPGLAGIKVSNGDDIVTTDETGRYEIPIGDDTILFVIKPRGYMTPVNDDFLPQFYYIHKPAGSPPEFKYAGVAPTGPLPDSVDFPLAKRAEPDKFRALIFGDTQPRDIAEVEYMAHDVIAQVIANEGHGAALGVTLGDIVFDDLDVMKPHNQAIAMIGIPWYNVIGNHDLNYDAQDDEHSDETFERIYGPAYYSFDHGPTHFLVLDDVTWVGANGDQPGRYFGGLGEKQMRFIKNDLAMIPEDQLVVLMMHIPLTAVEDRQELYRLIEQRPAAVSLSAHTHFMEHRFIGEEDGWQGPEKHHHVINVTVCGSWWRGRKDERGIPHATMSDGGPNGYSIMEFDGADYSLDFRAAGRPAEYQMNIYAPESVKPGDVSNTEIIVNVFAGSEKTRCEMRVGTERTRNEATWVEMRQSRMADPAFVAEKERELQLQNKDWKDLPKPYETPHIWSGMLPAVSGVGTHVIEVRATWPDGTAHTSYRLFRVEE